MGIRLRILLTVLAVIVGGVAGPPAGAAEELTPATRSLFLAVRTGDFGAVRASLLAGADVKSENAEGLTPFDVAVNKGHFNIAYFLIAWRERQTAEQAGPPLTSPKQGRAAAETVTAPSRAMQPSAEPSPPAMTPASPAAPSLQAGMPAPETPAPATTPEPSPADAPAGKAPGAPSASRSPPASPVVPPSPPVSQAATQPEKPVEEKPEDATQEDVDALMASVARFFSGETAGTPPAPTDPAPDPAPPAEVPASGTPATEPRPATEPAVGQSEYGPEVFDKIARFLAGDGNGLAEAQTPETAASEPPLAAPVTDATPDKTAESVEYGPELFDAIKRFFIGEPRQPATGAAPASTAKPADTPPAPVAEGTATATPAPAPEAIAPAAATPPETTAPDSKSGRALLTPAADVPAPASTPDTPLPPAVEQDEPAPAGPAPTVTAAPEPAPVAAETAAIPPDAVPASPPALPPVSAPVPTQAKAPPAGPAPEEPSQPSLRVAPFLGESMKLGAARPASLPGACVRKKTLENVFCIEPVDWAPEIGSAFEVQTNLYRGRQAIVRYDRGEAVQAQALFPAGNFEAIVRYFTQRFGPPAEKPVIWAPLVGEPNRRNRTFRWLGPGASGPGTVVLEVRKIDDLRWSSPPDPDYGVAWLYRRGGEPIFRYVSWSDFLLAKARRRGN